ncbi:MAG: glycoside hydrolase family 3 protein [Treponema sp.]|jgi:beta-N-acetylhexosaminidase|nr:glycoside hydrolase family 3 protein [Treponema sp.]
MPRRLVFLSLLALFACAAPSGRSGAAETAGKGKGVRREALPPLNREWLRRSAELVTGMDRRQLAAQVILTAVEGRDALPRRTRLALGEIPVGGIMLFGYNIGAGGEKTRRFIAELGDAVQSASGVRPFIAADQEGGTVQRFRGNAALPPPLSYWERVRGGSGRSAVLEAIRGDAAAAGRELRACGVSLNLAPVAEILNDENTRFLRDRSYGPDAVFTREAAGAFVRGMEETGTACTLKHFPGNSGADPHRTKAYLALSGGELDRFMLPFAAIIKEEDPAAVMISHVIVPAWDDRPASLSPAALAKLRDLGFRGIAVADDFAMAAAGAPVEVCVVQALNAGVDMVMSWPGDLRKIHGALVAALEEGDLKEARLREAAQKILYQKLRYGLIQPGRL